MTTQPEREPVEPLYDNKRLQAMLDEVKIRDKAQRLYYYVYQDGIKLLRRIRDDYEADRARLAQQVAERDARIKGLEAQVTDMEASLHFLGAALSGVEGAWDEIEDFMFGEESEGNQ